jgi:hypothetical protein
MTKEVYNRIHDRMNEIRKSQDLAIDVLWDEERALWLAETHWRLRQGGPAHRSVDIIAAEGPTITDALAVAAGYYPSALQMGRRKQWDRKALDVAVDRRSGLTASSPLCESDEMTRAIDAA